MIVGGKNCRLHMWLSLKPIIIIFTSKVHEYRSHKSPIVFLCFFNLLGFFFIHAVTPKLHSDWSVSLPCHSAYKTYKNHNSSEDDGLQRVTLTFSNRHLKRFVERTRLKTTRSDRKPKGKVRVAHGCDQNVKMDLCSAPGDCTVSIAVHKA